MMYVNEKQELVIEPSYTPFGVITHPICNADNCVTVLNQIVVDWLIDYKGESITFGSITFHLKGKETTTNKYILSYTIGTSAVETELFRHDDLGGIAEWFYDQFEQLTGKVMRYHALENNT